MGRLFVPVKHQGNPCGELADASGAVKMVSITHHSVDLYSGKNAGYVA